MPQRSIPAPYHGVNSVDPLSAMRPTEARAMANFLPGNGVVTVRKGSTVVFTTVGAGAIESLMTYDSKGTEHLLAASSTAISRIDPSPSSLATGLTSGRWQSAMMNETMGLVNGDDAPRTYDGTSLATMTVSGSGLTVADLFGIHVHNGRSYFWTDDSTDFWYSALNTLGGTLTKFPLSRISKTGGKMVAMESLSVSGSSGSEMNQHAVFILSTGEVIIYAGIDPGSASDWALIGSYRIGRPIGDVRCVGRVDGDIWIITDRGYIGLNDAINRSGRPRRSALDGLAKDAVVAASANTGWEIHYAQQEQLVWVNVPTTSTLSTQHVVNLCTGASTTFTGMNSRCWANYNGKSYYGRTTAGETLQAFSDAADDDGTAIGGRIEQAWFPLSGSEVHINEIRLHYSGSASMDYNFAIGEDYNDPTQIGRTFDNTTETAWESGGWQGTVFSPELNLCELVGFEWYQTDFDYDPIT